MKTLALVNWASILERAVTQFRGLSWRRVPLPASEAAAIRDKPTLALEAVSEAQATLEKYGGG